MLFSTTIFAQDSVTISDSINFNNGRYQGQETNQNKLIGGRSKASIMSVVLQNLSDMRKIYNKRLRSKPGLEGKITFKFAIDEFGKVIFCGVVETTINDEILENKLIEEIHKWEFEKIEKPGDVTEVIYPFIFSQQSNYGAIAIAYIMVLLALILPMMLLYQD